MPDEQMQIGTKHPNDWAFNNNHAVYGRPLSPYNYGWVPEIEVTDASGATVTANHFSMGRFSHELALVMPDRRTVYMSDDQRHAGFFMYVADRAEDLSSGTIYGARFTHDGEGLSVDWATIGHFDDRSIRAAIDQGIQFSDLFDVAEVSACPSDFTRITTTWGTECLRIKDPKLAGALETRRVAAMLGSTTELTKSEGLALDLHNGVLYSAVSAVVGSMLVETEPTGPGFERLVTDDHLRFESNPCGKILALRRGEAVTTEGAKIDSPWVMRSASTALQGSPIEQGKQCDRDAIANPDNITFADEHGLMFIAEDTSKHARDTLWAWSPKTGELTAVMKVDGHGEVSGLGWTSDVGGFGYLAVSYQVDDRDYPTHRSIAGLYGPFPIVQ